MDEELKSKMRAFREADYPKVGEHLLLESCLETITGNPNSRIIEEDGKPFVMIGMRKFELIDLHCPDLKKPNAHLFDESAQLEVSLGRYIIIYYMLNNSEVDHAEIYEEDEKGFIERRGRKYRLQSIIGHEKVKEGIDIQI